MTLSNNLVFLDTETTGLSLDHDIWEVAYAIGDGPVQAFQLPHRLHNADPKALELNGYRVRARPAETSIVWDVLIAKELEGKSIVGANPSFDAYRLERRWGRAPWHYRLIDVESMAIPLFNLEKPLGLKGLVDKLADIGYTVSENDHTATGDVRTVREIYKILLELGEPSLHNIRKG